MVSRDQSGDFRISIESDEFVAFSLRFGSTNHVHPVYNQQQGTILKRTPIALPSTKGTRS
jgi:hypothetical protein